MRSVHPSKVAVAIKREYLQKLSFETIAWLSRNSESYYRHDDGIMYIFDSIEWETWVPDIGRLYEELGNLDDPEQYLVLELCKAAPDIDYNDIGEWEDNPWNIRKEMALAWNDV